MDIASAAADLGLLKTGLDTIKGLLGLVRDVNGVLPKGEKKDAIDRSLAVAESQLRLAEAQIAKSFNYRFCQCQAPIPTPMPKAGHFISALGHRSEVYECPICRSINADVPHWTRRDGSLATVPEVVKVESRRSPRPYY